jgi:hypothetical protein
VVAVLRTCGMISIDLDFRCETLFLAFEVNIY